MLPTRSPQCSPQRSPQRSQFYSPTIYNEYEYTDQINPRRDDDDTILLDPTIHHHTIVYHAHLVSTKLVKT
jgi:hypothetical protein